MRCALCDNMDCLSGKDCAILKDRLMAIYSSGDERSMRAAAAVESRYYCEKTRLEEVVLYCSAMGYRKVGIAFCIGLSDLARELHRALTKHFEVHSVCCKVCGISKSDLRLESLHSGASIEAMCNPIGQALALNEAETDLNLTLGLCVGHDTLFIKHSTAPVSPFIVKDRVLGNNPAVALSSRYYKNRRENMVEIEKIE